MTLDATPDRLLSELDRQQKYLDRLPSDFQFPLFNARQALESQRRNGYRNTAAAAREIIDNALEAGATRIDVRFDRPQRRDKNQRADAVSAIAFIDNGSGMKPMMARYALSWGGGTHFDEPDLIGKFGFGLPNASINQCRRVEVYTKTADADAITLAWLDTNDFPEHGIQSIPEPVTVNALPAFVQRFLDAEGVTFEHGTVVLWVLPDRLTYRMAGSLREHLVDDFGVTYRNMLDGLTLTVEGTEVGAVDPLFLSPHARLYKTPEEGGAIETFSRRLPVRYFRDAETGALQLRRLANPGDLADPGAELIAAGVIGIRIGRLPPGFAGAGKGADEAAKRFEIRKSRRGMSFVRAGREIETLDAFPRSVRDTASGLGRWPLLQGYAYHWGIEVSFEPVLDEVFGITNDKQTVRPIEDFWKLLAQEEIDRLLRDENRWQTQARKSPPTPKPEVTPTPAEQAAAAADSSFGRGPEVPPHQRDEARQREAEEANRIASTTGASLEAILESLREEAKRRPYRIEYVELDNAPFYVPEWGPGPQVVVNVNRKHAFYSSLYAELLKLPGSALPKQAVDVLLIALAKAELNCEDAVGSQWYKRQRMSVWSPFLEDALTILGQTMRPGDDDPTDSEPPVGDDDGDDAPAETAVDEPAEA